MITSPPFATHLANATGLSQEKAMHLYQVGAPWPLSTTHATRRAYRLAQAQGMSFDEAHAITRREAYLESTELLRLGHQHLLAKGHPELMAAIEERILALPFMKEQHLHFQRVVGLTQENPVTLFRLLLALQEYALDHPGWDQEEVILDVGTALRPTHWA